MPAGHCHEYKWKLCHSHYKQVDIKYSTYNKYPTVLITYMYVDTKYSLQQVTYPSHIQVDTNYSLQQVPYHCHCIQVNSKYSTYNWYPTILIYMYVGTNYSLQQVPYHSHYIIFLICLCAVMYYLVSCLPTAKYGKNLLMLRCQQVSQTQSTLLTTGTLISSLHTGTYKVLLQQEPYCSHYIHNWHKVILQQVSIIAYLSDLSVFDDITGLPTCPEQ